CLAALCVHGWRSPSRNVRRRGVADQAHAMTQSYPLNDKDRSDLIAYLDGELEGEAARAVEARISRDPAVRAEAESLKRTWDLLDYLPRPEPAPNFTHRTLDKLSTHATRAALRQKRPLRRWLYGTGWAAAVVLVGLVGY